MHTTKLLAAAVLITLASAHPGPHPEISKREITRRHDLSSRCAAHVANFNSKRIKRNLNKRFPGSGHNTTVQIQSEAPYFQTIQNDTCVLTPEVTEGPYVWPQSQTLRQDMTEDQVGIPLWLDVGVLDMETCEPLEGVLVDFWHCNATGSYSSFTGLSPNTAFPTLLNQLNISDFEIGTTDLHTDDTTWLRGMWPTDKNGMMEMKTVFPGMFCFPFFLLISFHRINCSIQASTSQDPSTFTCRSTRTGRSAATAPWRTATRSAPVRSTSMNRYRRKSWRRSRMRRTRKSTGPPMPMTVSLTRIRIMGITLLYLLFLLMGMMLRRG
jgi:protocatechuate 3,4-dioxygenase beta subunit